MVTYLYSSIDKYSCIIRILTSVIGTAQSQLEILMRYLWRFHLFCANLLLILAEIRINGKTSQVTKRVFNVLYSKKIVLSGNAKHIKGRKGKHLNKQNKNLEP